MAIGFGGNSLYVRRWLMGRDGVMTYTRVSCVYCGLPRNRTKSLFCHKDARRLGVKLVTTFKPRHYFALARAMDWNEGRSVKFLDIGV